jgi:hypothetical protein
MTKASGILVGIDPKLRIDGVDVSFLAVGVLHQRDPFPGGHRWWLGLQGPGADGLLEAPRGKHSPPSEEDARRVLRSLDLFLQQFPRENVLFLLNNVDLVETEEGRIHLAGVCSPIVPS